MGEERDPTIPTDPEAGGDDTTPDTPPDPASAGSDDQSSTPPAGDDTGIDPAVEAEYAALLEQTKSANDRLADAGRTRKSLEEQLAEKDALIAQLAAQSSQVPAPPAEPPALPPTQNEYDIYGSIKGLEEVPQPVLDVAQIQHNALKETEARLEKHLAEMRAQNEAHLAELVKAREAEDEFAKYSSTYGITRQEYDAMSNARASGDNFTADRLLELSRTRHEALRVKAEAERDANANGSFTPPGGSTNPNISMENTSEEFRNQEVAKVKAMSPNERTAYVQENFFNYDEATQEAIMRLPPATPAS